MNRRRSALVLVAVVSLAGCEVTRSPRGTDTPQSGAPETTSTPTAPAPTTTTTTTAPTATATATTTATVAPENSGQANVPPGLEGRWESRSCGERKYPRIIELKKDGTFHADDLVSPCPKNVACVWSGIITRDGKWSVSGKTLTLTPSGAAPAGPGGAPFPATLDVAPTPAEVVNGLRCAYQPAASPQK